MAGDPPIREGQVLTGALFSEPMRVETIRQNGASAWDKEFELIGVIVGAIFAARPGGRDNSG